ncbi:MAG: DUF348 domain-containing protein [Clostridia bacterium]|nr:DUF348 domain-containing protein [Clostridia bacterium]
MVNWIKEWGQKKLNGRYCTWMWLLVAAFLFISATGWVAVNSVWKQVTIELDGREIQTRTFAADVASLLAENQISLNPEDRVSPALDAALTSKMTVRVERAVTVTIGVDGQEKEIAIPPAATVAEALNKAGIELNPEDQVTPPANTVLAAGERVKVTRITSEIVTEQKEIPYRVERRANTQIEKGINQVVQRGQKGLAEERYRVVYEDGQEVSRELIATEVIKEPVTEIVSVGALQLASRGGRDFRFQRAFVATATAYTHTGNRTKTGVWPQVGTIAVDPSVIPLGSRLYVEGYGFGTAQDVGSSIKGNRIDVFVDTEAEARRWGVRQVKVYVLQ